MRAVLDNLQEVWRCPEHPPADGVVVLQANSLDEVSIPATVGPFDVEGKAIRHFNLYITMRTETMLSYSHTP